MKKSREERLHEEKVNLRGIKNNSLLLKESLGEETFNNLVKSAEERIKFLEMDVLIQKW